MAKMRFVELFYNLTSGKDLNDGGKNDRFWGNFPDGQFFFLSPKEEFNFIHYDLERDGDKVSCEAESAFWRITDLEDSCAYCAPWHMEYEDYKFLFETEVIVEGAIGFRFFRNLYVSIKGSCGKKCNDISHDYEEHGYCLNVIPPCDGEKIIDTYSYTGKWPTFYDYIIDIGKWMSLCRDLDVAINVHRIYDVDEQVVSADTCDYCAFLIQGNRLTITPKDLGKIYLKYHKKTKME